MATIDGKKTGGRQKGVGNKNIGQLRGMIIKALDKAGNDEYLYQQSIENPVAFMTLIGKIIPKQVDLDANVNGNLNISKIIRTIIDPTDDTNS